MRLLEHHRRLNKRPKKQQDNNIKDLKTLLSGVQFLNTLKGGTLLRSWCVEKCLPFSCEMEPPIFFEKICQEMVILLAFRSDGASYRLVSSSSECMNQNTRWECSSRGRAREPCGGGRRTDDIKELKTALNAIIVWRCARWPAWCHGREDGRGALLIKR